MNTQTAILDDELLTRAQIRERLKVSNRTLWDIEQGGNGPPKVTVGRTVRYPKSLFEKFLADRLST